MKHERLENMTKGWFVGQFSPSAFSTEACEVAVKYYAAGDSEASHYHGVATEITVIISGSVRMMDREWRCGDIVVLSPGEKTAFEALTDAISVVVKVPGILNDKFVAD